jgi:hypothetical protein
MPKMPSAVSVFSVPLLGLGLLVWSLGSARSLGGDRVVSEIGQERMPLSAAFNGNRLLVLGCQYRHYQSCRRRLTQAHTEQEHLLVEANVVEAIEDYNRVAQDTDPSAFTSTLLPKRLPEK